MKKVMVGMLMFLSLSVQAAPEINCFVEAAVGDAIARERDAGTPQVDALHEAQGQFEDKLEPSKYNLLVEEVYDQPTFTRNEVYSNVLHMCIDMSYTVSKK